MTYLERNCEPNEENGWISTGSKKSGIEIYSKTVPNQSLPMTMGRGIIKAPPLAVLDLIIDVDRKSEYDSMYHSGRLVEQLDDRTAIVYQCYKAIWPVSSRDFCLVSRWHVEKNGVVKIAITSADHEDCPKQKSAVRGNILMGGFVLEPYPADGPGSTSCRVTYVTHVDPCGKIPKSVVNMMATRQPMVVAAMKKLMERQTDFSHVDMNRFSVQPRECHDHQSENESDQSIRLLDLADQSTEELLYAGDITLSRTAQSLDWLEVDSNFQDCAIYRHRTHTELYRGDAFVAGSPAEIANLLIDPSCHRWFDDELVFGKTLKRIDEQTRVVHLGYQANDSILVSKHTVLGDGSHIVVFRSTMLSSAPDSTSDSTRSDVSHAWGYLLYPDGNNSSRLVTVLPSSIRSSAKLPSPVAIVNATRSIGELLL